MSRDTLIADLELSVAPLYSGLGLTLRYRRPGDAGEDTRGPFAVQLDLTELTALSVDGEGYGAILTRALLADPTAQQEFVAACDGALEAGLVLRVRLHLLDPSLQDVRWELLRDPVSGVPLALNTRLLLSRFISAGRRGRVEIRPREEARALVAVSAPRDIARYGFSPIDAGAEVARVRDAFALISVDSLGGEQSRCTLDALGDRLRSGSGYTILYLVAHGGFRDGASQLYLEHEVGRAVVEQGEALAQLLESLDERQPRLVVLASCESAGDGFAKAVAALGPRIAQTGVPAVLGMQGKLSTRTVERFAPIFFSELMRDGRADRALAVARLAVRERPDWWMPVLYSRLREGRIWDVGPQLHAETASTPSITAAASVGVDRVSLRKALGDQFSLDELVDLMFDMGIDHEYLPGSGKTARVRELILFCERRGRLGELVEQVCRIRPELVPVLQPRAQG